MSNWNNDVFIVCIYDNNLNERIDFKRCHSIPEVMKCFADFVNKYKDKRWCAIEIDRKRDDA